MPALLDAFPFPFHLREAQQLLATLSKLYTNVAKASAIAEDSGIDTTQIDTEQAVYFVWREILKEASKQGILRQLIQNIVDRLSETSPVRPFLQDLLANKTSPPEAEPLRPDGSPKFINGNDEVKNNESLLYRDDLTLQIGRLPAFIEVLQRMLQFSPAVCKLSVDINAVSQVGTAFRISEDLLLTNWHVVHDEENKVRATSVNAEFGYQDNGSGGILSPQIIQCDVNSIVTSEADDWAIIRVQSAMDNAWPVIKLSEAVPPVLNTSAYIIQHPLGGSKRIGFVRNQVSQFDDRVVQYITDTQEGSSGAPVFNSFGMLIALHHAGGRPQEIVGRPPLKKNEGIRISRIISALAEQNIHLP
ncbi:MAG: serine protease [Chitinophagaceae bacterium]